MLALFGPDQPRLDPAVRRALLGLARSLVALGREVVRAGLPDGLGREGSETARALARAREAETLGGQVRAEAPGPPA